MNFRDFGLAEPLLRAVLQEGYTVATPIQAQAIPTVLEGHDVIGLLRPEPERQRLSRCQFCIVY
jgi:superfamily II DNA/RNA helicase